MNIQELIRRVRNSLSPHDHLTNEAVQGFLRVLEQVREEELSCKEINAKLDEYVELKIKKENAAHIMPLIREHLDLCPECCEEYEALLDVVEKSSQN
jgi:hypothetical protein